MSRKIFLGVSSISIRVLLGWGLALLYVTGIAWAKPKVEVTTLSPGEGPAVHQGDRVALSYRLSLADGTLIEATPPEGSYDMTLGSTTVIPGLSEGVEGMKRGEKRRIVIPPELAYGAKGSGKIPAQATLIFEVELLYPLGHLRGADAGATDVSAMANDEHTGHDHEGHSHRVDGLVEFGEDGSVDRPSATETTNMAMSEYMLRDFYTRPWRFKDANERIWRKSFILLGLALILGGLSRYRRDRTR